MLSLGTVFAMSSVSNLPLKVLRSQLKLIPGKMRLSSVNICLKSLSFLIVTLPGAPTEDISFVTGGAEHCD